MLHMLRTVLIVVSVLLSLPSARAVACSLRGNGIAVVDANEVGVDLQAPVLSSVRSVFNGNVSDDPLSSCGDIASLDIVVGATDDRTADEELGYSVRLVEGVLPAGLLLSEPSVLVGAASSIHLYMDSDPGAFNFAVEVVAIDLAGNESAPRSLRITHEVAGCSIGGSARRWPASAMMFLASLLVLRRRR